MAEYRNEWYEKEFINIHEKIKDKKFLNLLNFLKIRNFKAQQYTQEKENNVKNITEKAFKLADKNNDIDALKFLINNLHGVNIPTASAILAMKYPDKYAIIDDNTIYGLDSKRKLRKNKLDDWIKYYKQYDKKNKKKSDKKYEIYKAYLKIIKEEKKSLNKSLRETEIHYFKLGQPLKKDANKKKKWIKKDY